ncbi:MAG: hypothetical protein US13_C0009G0024 [candidate division TM6 bacterium GW2011_GWE2_36_25]|nr:MAG: hypothetical protein US13_C0009G0024 [candidate division TM6 bacterium GW2011_GWE2_36_25]KKQ18959.1 MAG: hypothetical protein US32_C0019G0002 [candidate division TM6 bacterium GW2011_GWA2_36_9]
MLQCAIKNINLFFYGGIIMNKKTIVLSVVSLLSLSSLNAITLDGVISSCKNGAHGTVQFCESRVHHVANASRTIASGIYAAPKQVISGAKHGFAKAQDALMFASGRVAGAFYEHPRCVVTAIVVTAATPVLWKTRNKVKSAFVKMWKKLPFVK